MTFFSLLTNGGWHWLAALGALMAAFGASYFGGKKLARCNSRRSQKPRGPGKRQTA